MAGSTAAIPAADATPAADSAASGTGTIAAAAQELKIAERELDNLREREKDARWEANRTAEEIERFRYFGIVCINLPSHPQIWGGG